MSAFGAIKSCFNFLGKTNTILSKFTPNFHFQIAGISAKEYYLEGTFKQPKTHPYPFKDKTRCYFPRPKETKRIGVHGFDKRMETSGGRRVLMRRILKGRHCISH